MSHIAIERCEGFQIIRMIWSKDVPGFQQETFESVRLALKAADATDEIRCTVFVGTPSCFCLGTDAAKFGEERQLPQLAKTVREFFKQLINSQTPLIAAVDGDAVGLGMTMLLHFDAIFATPQCSFKAPFAEWGLVPEAASSILLPDVLGYRRAFEVFCLGGVLTAAEARATGFLTCIYERSELEAKVREAARQISKLPPRAITATREMMREGRSRLQRRSALETATFHELLSDKSTQRRLKVMARAARLGLAS